MTVSWARPVCWAILPHSYTNRVTYVDSYVGHGSRASHSPLALNPLQVALHQSVRMRTHLTGAEGQRRPVPQHKKKTKNQTKAANPTRMGASLSICVRTPS